MVYLTKIGKILTNWISNQALSRLSQSFVGVLVEYSREVVHFLKVLEELRSPLIDEKVNPILNDQKLT